MTPAEFQHIKVTELHPTFGAEIAGVDFALPIPNEVFGKILAACNKVVLYQNQARTNNADH